MKNITLAVDDDVLAAVRRYAVEHSSTVNALVREHLNEIARREDRARSARARIVELSNRSPARLGPKSWTREDLYER